MSSMDIFLWAVCPYLAFSVLIVGTAIRRVYFARTWSAKSSEFLEKKHERVATPLFHLAILFVFFGHVGGLLVPQQLTDALGVSEQMYHAVAFVLGGIAGTALVVAVIMLVGRRFGSNKRMRAATSSMDKVLYVMLAITILTGMIATISNAQGAFNYRESLAPWIRGVLLLQPDPSLMAATPLPFKVHMMCWMVLFALIPFTRLVHLFSGITAPFRYVGRAAIVYRRRARNLRARAGEQDLEFPSGVAPSKKEALDDGR